MASPHNPDEAATGRSPQGRTLEERKAALQARFDAVAANPPPQRPKPPATFDDRCKAWVNLALKVFRDGARLTEEAETGDVALGPHAGLALLAYDRMVGRRIDAELRSILDEEAT